MKREKHGMKGTVEYTVWQNMKARVGNPNNLQYCDYGGRGITICDRWLHSFSNFYKDMGDRPGKEYSLDRINNNGNYEPSNCHWATRIQQIVNTRIRKSNSSGYRGIIYIPKNHKYQANVNYDKKRYYLGYYNTPEEAAYVRDQVALQLYGSGAQFNFEYV